MFSKKALAVGKAVADPQSPSRIAYPSEMMSLAEVADT